MASLSGASSSSSNSLNFLICLMLREDNGKEACVWEAHVNTKEELEDEEVTEDECRYATAVCCGGVVYKRKRE